MLFVTDSKKDVDTAARDVEEAVKRNGFGVLHVYDLQEKLREKGVDLPHACRILEVCNPKQAAKVLAADMEVSLALPCRISVYDDGGQTKIGTIQPTALLSIFPGAAALQPVAEEVEQVLVKIIEEAR
ncbi:MAG: DUF302 domain-containing protein [Deltaproteobacteria bacterium]|nr:DUF302 domain-containing protein [Deltaproteobacteria bacterium]